MAEFRSQVPLPVPRWAFHRIWQIRQCCGTSKLYQRLAAPDNEGREWQGVCASARESKMRRGLLTIALGIAFLILVTWLGTVVTNIVPHNPTAPVQEKQAGPYSVTLQITPNPPPITQPAT